MYDAHVKAAEKATQDFLNIDLGLNHSLEAAASILREAGELWSRYRDELNAIEEQADLHFAELAMEM